VDAYPGKSGDWSIDIWVTNRIETTAFEYIKELNEKLTPEHRQRIMEIKQYYHRQGKLRDGLSLKIYRAVIELGIRTVGEFEDYILNA
jgi:hypothetical protein